MALQYISDTVGNKTAVIIPIEEWNQLREKYPNIESFEDDTPKWQKDILDYRRSLINQPGQLIPLDEFLREMEQDADEEI